MAPRSKTCHSGERASLIAPEAANMLTPMQEVLSTEVESLHRLPGADVAETKTTVVFASRERTGSYWRRAWNINEMPGEFSMKEVVK